MISYILRVAVALSARVSCSADPFYILSKACGASDGQHDHGHVALVQLEFHAVGRGPQTTDAMVSLPSHWSHGSNADVHGLEQRGRNATLQTALAQMADLRAASKFREAFAAKGASAASAAHATLQTAHMQPGSEPVHADTEAAHDSAALPQTQAALTAQAVSDEAPRAALLQTATVSDAHSQTDASLAAQSAAGSATNTDASAAATSAAAAAASASAVSSTASSVADSAALKVAVERMEAELTAKMQAEMQAQVKTRVQHEIAERERTATNAKSAEQAYAAVMDRLSYAAEYVDDAVIWSDRASSLHPNLKAFLLPVAILLTIVLGMTCCWTDVEKLSVRSAK